MGTMNELGFEILYEEGPCLVVCKPPGLSTQAPPGIDSLEVRIKQYLKQREAKPGNVYLGVPHRLDRPASGAIVFARHSRAARRIAEQFECRRVEKVYWACVEGHVSPDEGTWRDWVRKIPDMARAEVVAADHPGAREAVMHYRTIARFDWGAWLEIRLETGRMHQVRIQCSSRGHSLLGDQQYGAATLFGIQYADPRLRAIALHARSLDFDHPMTHRQVRVVAPLPQAWLDHGVSPPAV